MRFSVYAEVDAGIRKKLKVIAPYMEELLKSDKVSQILLFGSCSRGEAVGHSDIDISVVWKSKPDVTLSEPLWDLEELDGMPVQFTRNMQDDYETSNHPFFVNLRREGIPWLDLVTQCML